MFRPAEPVPRLVRLSSVVKTCDPAFRPVPPAACRIPPTERHTAETRCGVEVIPSLTALSIP